MFLTIAYLLMALSPVNLLRDAHSDELTLRATLTKQGKDLTIISTPLDTTFNCTLELHASPRSSALRDLDNSTLILQDISNQGGPRGYRAKNLKSAHSSLRSPIVHLRSKIICPDRVLLSNISKIKITQSLKGKRSTESWITLLRSKIGPPVLNLNEAFPELSFDKPVDIQHAGDGSNRIFIVEQGGKIYSFSNNTKTKTKSLFLDVSERVLSGGERGLLGLAFHPRFSSNGLFFIHYSKLGTGDTIIARYKTNDKKTKALPTSETIILEQTQPYANHNGGQIAFGKDGYLYIALGDGGSAGDPQKNGQNRAVLLGKILRIDVNRKSGASNYSIPNSNPFKGNSEGFREEIFAYGLRNPWRMNFDRKSGALWVADVGQNALEEVNIVENGKNYGWSTMEGNQCYNALTCDQTGLTLPVAQYGRTLGRSISGGLVYRGSASPSLNGLYIFGDFVTGRIWSLDGSGNSGAMTELFDTDHFISSFGSDEAGEIFLLSYYTGKVLTIR